MATHRWKMSRGSRILVVILFLGAVIVSLLIYKSDLWLHAVYRVKYEEWPTLEWIRSRTLTCRWDDSQIIIQAYYVETGFMSEEYRSGTRGSEWTREGKSMWSVENVVTGHVEHGIDQREPTAPWWVYDDSLYR